MKIVHVGLVGPFNEDMSYQGSILPKENRMAGHDVIVIASCYRWDRGKIIKVPEEDRVTKDGIRLIRLKYDKIISQTITEKIRKSNKLMAYLEDINPDVILNHDLQTYELLTVSKYKKNNPSVKLYADSHTDSNNSATNWVSLNLLHKIFYRIIIKISLRNFDKILYISCETRDFLKAVYKVQEDLLEFYPLGGIIISEEEKLKFRKEKRKELGISEESILFCHSGKMDYKKRTYELLDNFVRVKDSNLKLIIIGTFTEDVERRVMPIINSDERIIYLGWKNSSELIKYIAASDLYLQPGSQSATMQNALCAGTPVMFANVKSAEAYMCGNAFAINSLDEIEMIFNQISENLSILDEMSKKAYDLARKLLDYRRLAARLCEQ